MIAAAEDTVVNDTYTTDRRRERIWLLLDEAFLHRAWVTMFSRDHHADVHANVTRWVETRRQLGLAIALDEERIIGFDEVTTVLQVVRMDRQGGARSPFLSVHFPSKKLALPGGR